MCLSVYTSIYNIHTYIIKKHDLQLKREEKKTTPACAHVRAKMGTKIEPQKILRWQDAGFKAQVEPDADVWDMMPGLLNGPMGQ